MNRCKVFFAALALASAAHAGVDSPEAGGYLSRGLLMWAGDNLPGTIDQLGRAEVLTDGDAGEECALVRALAAAREGAPDARLLLGEFLNRYPSSGRRSAARLAVADLDFAASRWADAFRGYEEVDPRSLTQTMALDRLYRMGYCRLMLGDYEQALGAMERLEASGMERYAGAARFYRAYVAYARGDYAKALPLMEEVPRTGEPGASAPFFIMQMRFAGGEWEKALAEARRLIDGAAGTPQYRAEALRVAGESLYNLGHESEATPYLWKYAAAVENPAPSVFYILGLSEYRGGNDDAAIKLLQRVIPDGGPLTQGAYLLLGQAYMRRGNLDEALMAFESAYRLDYDRQARETAFYNYAVARMEGGKVPFGSSVDVLEKFLAEFPDSRYAPEVERYVVTGYITDNNYESALEAIGRVKNPGRDILEARQRVLFVVATRDYQAGDVTRAESRLREVVAMGRGYDDSILAQSRLWLGDCLYARGDYAGAAAAYEAFLKSGHVTAANRLTALYNLMYAGYQAGDYKSALATASKASKAAAGADAHPRLRADIANRSGDCRYYGGDFNGALADYAKAWDLDPASGDYALYQMAVVKGLKGDHCGKIADIDRLTASFPGTGLVPRALLGKAESQAAIGDTKGAIATYRKLVDGHATTAPGRNGYLQLALIYLNTGRRREAEATYREVIASYPSSDEARLAADDLKRLYAADGRLGEYAEFVKSVPGAPSLDAVEMDRLTFDAAEQAYAGKGETALLERYLNEFPTGALRAKALYYLADDAWNSGHASRAVSLAARVVETYPHSEAAEGALLIKGEAEASLGKHRAALASFTALEQSASGSSMLHDALMGAMRSASALKLDLEVVKRADALLASSAVPAESLGEARYLRAVSLDRLGRHNEADAEWRALAANPAHLHGSMSAVALAGSLLDRGRLKEAAAVADAFINANPPHRYWLARGFIVYSDVLRARGDSFEADEYLKSLRANYPGKEPDIFEMINQRLPK